MGFLSNLFGGKTSEVEQSATEDGRTAEASPQTAPLRRFSAQYPAP